MSRIIKIYLKDTDYNRIYNEHGDIATYMYQLLGCQSDNTSLEKYISDKIKSFEIGKEFSYRDIFDNDPEKMTAANARLVRYICRCSDFAECLRYDSADRTRIYRRVKENRGNDV